MVTNKNSNAYQECTVLVKRVKRDTLNEKAQSKLTQEIWKKQEALMVNKMEELRIDQDQTQISVSNNIFDLSSIKQSLFYLEENGVNQKKYRRVYRQRLKNELYQFYYELWFQLKQNDYKKRIDFHHRYLCIHEKGYSECMDLEQFGDNIFMKLKDGICFSQCFAQVPQAEKCLSLNFLRIMYKQLEGATMDTSESSLQFHYIRIMLEESEKQLILLNELTRR